jgi:hypothetical protein
MNTRGQRICLGITFTEVLFRVERLKICARLFEAESDSPMLGPVHLPLPSVIDSWDNLEDLPIVETAPRSVPITVYVRHPEEDRYSRIFSLKTNLDCLDNLRYVAKVGGCIASVDRSLAAFYSARGISSPLLGHINSFKSSVEQASIPRQFQTPEFQAICLAVLRPKYQFLSHVKRECDTLGNVFVDMFKAREIWDQGRYSDRFLDQLCLLVHKCHALEQLAPVKKGLVNDISHLLKYAGSAVRGESGGNEFPGLSELRFWVSSRNSVTGGIIKAIIDADIDQELCLLVFNILVRHIRSHLEGCLFVYPEMQYAYIDTYIFLIRFFKERRHAERMAYKKQCGLPDRPQAPAAGKSKNDMKEDKKKLDKYKKMVATKLKLQEFKADLVAFTREIFSVHPNVPEYMEMTQIVEEGVWRKAMEFCRKNNRVKVQPSVSVPSLDEQLDLLTKTFGELSHHISEIVTSDAKRVDLTLAKTIIDEVTDALHHVGSALNRIRERLSFHLTRPPAGCDLEISNFEKSMRIGIPRSGDLRLFLLTLQMCRAMKEIMQTNLPEISECITNYIQDYMQKFAWNTLQLTITRNPKPVVDMAKVLQLLIGFFNETQYATVQHDKHYLGRHNPSVPKCAPHIAVIELVRVQLSACTNPESVFQRHGNTRLNAADQKDFLRFLDDTRYFIDLLKLGETLDVVCDQSSLFFKEYYLEAEGVSFFPVTASLPVILSEYALDNYARPELTGAMFYPLSIYDDAAATALRKLRSRYLYDEIKAEAKICLLSIIRKLSDAAFHPIRRFASLRMLGRRIRHVVQQRLGQDSMWEGVSVLKTGVLLQQNQLSLLGCQIDTKSMIADRLNEIMNEEIEKIMTMTEKNGILAAIAVGRLFDMLELTHKLLLQFGVPLMPFQDLLSRALATDTPNSLQSILLINVSEHLVGPALSNFYLLTNPHRLIPKSKAVIDIKALHHGPIGDVLSVLLTPTAAFVTTESFRELFWRLDDGAISLLHSQLLGAVSEIFNTFKECYASVGDRLIRMKDAPLATNCLQIYDRFEGAYRYFLEDRGISELFELMGEIGNAIAISEMMDNALLLKRQATTHAVGFLLNTSPGQPTPQKEPDFFTLFDKQFQGTRSYFANLVGLPKENEVMQPFLFKTVQEIARGVLDSNGIFDETAQDQMDLPSLKGFAARWSVLDFLFSLIEAGRVVSKEREEPGAIIKFGEGVHLCAAVILCITGQRSLFRAFSIGGKITAHSDTDFSSGAASPRIKNYRKVSQLVSSAFQCAVSVLQRTVDLVVKRK